MKFLQNIKDGFTLAEVLITLVIVGVIAAMTIPTLINNTNNQEYVAKLKKVYSTLAQATNSIIAEEGTPREWAATNEKMYNAYKKHLQNAKECGIGGACFPDISYKYLNGGYHASFINSGLYSLRLNDGTPILFGWADNGQCSQNAAGTVNYCGFIMIDLNAEKAPNTYGIDTHFFVIKENGLYPMGCDSVNCLNTNGMGCTCKVIREGAINY